MSLLISIRFKSTTWNFKVKDIQEMWNISSIMAIQYSKNLSQHIQELQEKSRDV